MMARLIAGEFHELTNLAKRDMRVRPIAVTIGAQHHLNETSTQRAIRIA
jgi:hypothetical protein